MDQAAHQTGEALTPPLYRPRRSGRCSSVPALAGIRAKNRLKAGRRTVHFYPRAASDRLRRPDARGGSFSRRALVGWLAWRAAAWPSIIGSDSSSSLIAAEIFKGDAPQGDLWDSVAAPRLGPRGPRITSSWGETCSASSAPTSACWAPKIAAAAATGSIRTASSTPWPMATPLPSMSTRSKRSRCFTSSPAPRPFRSPRAAAASAA